MGESGPARRRRRGCRKGSAGAGGATASGGAAGTLALPSSLPGRGSDASRRSGAHIRVPPAGDTPPLLPGPRPLRGAETPNFRRRRRRTATPQPSEGSYLRRPGARLRSAPPRAPLTYSEDEDGRHARGVSRSVSLRPGRRGSRGKASQRPPRAQARWEASRARTAGGRLAGGEGVAPPRGGRGHFSGSSPGAKPPTPPAAV